MSSRFLALFTIAVIFAVQAESKVCYKNPFNVVFQGKSCMSFTWKTVQITCCDDILPSNKEEKSVEYKCYDQHSQCSEVCGRCLTFNNEASGQNYYCCANKEDEQTENTNFRPRSVITPMGLATVGIECVGQCYNSSEICTEACSSCNPCADRFCCVM